jgi:hypothetical protein
VPDLHDHRANGSDLGSFLDEGFVRGAADPAQRHQRHRRGDGDYVITDLGILT